jgi:transposase
MERAAYQEEIKAIPKSKRYYVDESGINKFLYRERGRAPRGIKVAGKVSGKRFQRLSIVAAKCEDAIVERHEYGCNMNSRLFEFWFMLLLMVIASGSVIIMDNASFHRKKILKTMAKEAGCRVIFLPPYSPDYNPIEKVWANLKKFLKNHLLKFLSVSDAVYHYFEFA